MRHQIVPTKNVTALVQALSHVEQVSPDVPRIVLVHGFPGAGKTEASVWAQVKRGGILLRACPVWTPSSLLAALCKELVLDVPNSNQAKLEGIVNSLVASRRPIFLDDCDDLFVCNDTKKLLEMLRYIHDTTASPLVLVGMERFGAKIKRWEQLARRISRICEFEPLTLEDAAQIASARVEVGIAPDLLEHLHAEARGSCGRMVIGFDAIEGYALSRQLSTIGLADWKAANKKFFLDR